MLHVTFTKTFVSGTLAGISFDDTIDVVGQNDTWLLWAIDVQADQAIVKALFGTSDYRISNIQTEEVIA